MRLVALVCFSFLLFPAPARADLNADFATCRRQVLQIGSDPRSSQEQYCLGLSYAFALNHPKYYQATSLTGGENGLRGINVDSIRLLGFQLSFVDPLIKYYVLLVFVALALWVISRILASPFGAALEAIRENESRARACGFDVTKIRLLCFVLSGVFSGLAGSLSALHLSTVAIDSMHYHTSGQVLMMTLLGGMGTFFGPFIGAAAFLMIEDLVTVYTEHWQLIVGLIFIALVLFLPHGIWGTLLARLHR